MTVLDEITRSHLLSFLKNNKCLWNFPSHPLPVRGSYNCCMLNLWMCIDNLFYFSGIYIEPSDIDHVLFAIYDIKIAVLINLAHIACMEPPILYRFFCRLRIFVISLHDIRTLNYNLADLINRKRSSLLIHDPHLYLRHRQPYRARFAPSPYGIGGCNRRTFCRAVSFINEDRKFFFEPFHNLKRHCCPAGNGKSPGRKIHPA